MQVRATRPQIVIGQAGKAGWYAQRSPPPQGHFAQPFTQPLSMPPRTPAVSSEPPAKRPKVGPTLGRPGFGCEAGFGGYPQHPQMLMHSHTLPGRPRGPPMAGFLPKALSMAHGGDDTYSMAREVQQDLKATLTPSTVEKGMIVCHGFERGWVDNLFVSLNEFWLRDLATGDIVFNDDIEKGDIGPRSFQAQELIFTGEWAKDIVVATEVEIPPEVVRDFMGSWSEEMKALRERCLVRLEVELPEHTGAHGKMSIGPGAPVTVSQARKLVVGRIEELMSHEMAKLWEDENQEEGEDQDLGFGGETTTWAEDNPPPWVDTWPNVQNEGVMPEWEKWESSAESWNQHAVTWQPQTWDMPHAPDEQNGQTWTSWQEDRGQDPSGPCWAGCADSPHDAMQQESSQAEVSETPAPAVPERTPAPSAPELGPEMADGERTVLDWSYDQAQFAHLPALPAAWIRVQSSAGKIYYLNTVTGKATFKEPKELPPGWEELKSRSTGKVYFWNAEKQKSQFERPTE
eukprot:CAMPEP_0194540612 /NCGR_PEP_ID=MMETSP0253-20130528/80870_1 /TAXON_ID=2966 /ORGANISM="Noctiluca scintillans" /LENGTH=514 /DNA_ID=CAMNT_0039386997 /DNA_START=45 /DNA_END=1589 /DNA_ORIENTATION=-